MAPAAGPMGGEAYRSGPWSVVRPPADSPVAGRWSLVAVRWSMAAVRWPLFDGRCSMAAGRPPPDAAAARRRRPPIRPPPPAGSVFGVRCSLFGARCSVAKWRKDPRPRFPARKPQKSAKNRRSRPPVGPAVASALFRVNNPSKNHMS